MIKILVSIITVYYNREDRVIDSIQSLLNQTYENIEIIAVDDGSTDNTLEVLRSIKDPRYKVITHPNMGLTKSLIKAVKMAKGEAIAIHGSGDISHPERIKKQVEILQCREDIGVVGCYVKNYNSESGETTFFKSRIPPGVNLTDLLKQRNLFTHGEVMFRKKIYEQVGGYREFFKYAQDRDLWLRMSIVTNFYIVPEVLYTRYLFSDGVYLSVHKTILQKFLSDISRQSIELRLDGKQDLVELYGNYAPFFRKRNKVASKNFAFLALREFINKNVNNAHDVIKISINENRNLINMSIYLILKISQLDNRLSRLIRVVLQKIRLLRRRLIHERGNQT